MCDSLSWRVLQYDFFFLWGPDCLLILKAPPQMRSQWFPPPSFTPSLSDSVLPFFTFHHSLWTSAPDLLELKGLFRTPTLWSRPELSSTRKSTDDACCASATQWKKRRAKEEMVTVPGLSSTRSWGKCCQYIVWAVPVVVVMVQLCVAFNLDTEKRVVFTGPRGSYFGYSVEFFGNSSR